MALHSEVSRPHYPEGERAQSYDSGRARRGVVWSVLFMVSTMVGILALTALLYNIVNSAFGYVAVQNEIDPQTVVLEVEEQSMLSASNVTTSEDDEILAAGVAASPDAIGFFGYAYYQEHADTLKALAVDGVAPSPESVDSGEYSLSRPLFLYTDAGTLAEKPQVAAFVDYYLVNVSAVIEEVGYFPNDAAEMMQARQRFDEAVNGAPPADAAGDIHVIGSSTVAPLTGGLTDDFKSSGFNGDVTQEIVGTSAGLARFCDGEADIAAASRPINRSELEACRKAKRDLLEFRVGTDALAVVASRQNSFLENATREQLRAIFTTAETWSDVDPSWPETPIQRYIPGADSGTLDFFVESVFGLELSDLPKETLIAILDENVSAGLMRRLEHDQPFAERSQENVHQLVLERVIESTIVRSWSLTDSILRSSEIDAAVAEIPNGEKVFRSWLTGDFIRSPQSSKPEDAGIRTAILGTLWVIFITILFALPVGIGAAVYLEEYAGDSWFNRLIETNINNLAGVPSIIYGMLGLAIFVRALEPFTSGQLFGSVDPTTANGRTIISAGLTLGLLILPLIIINAREAIRAVPGSLRQASFGLGATQWQTVWSHVLPNALPGILTGAILSISRAIGETAPLVVIGASTFIVLDPTSPFAKFTTLPIQIYQWTSRPQAEFRNLAAAAIVVLLVLLLTLNTTAVILRNRFSSQRI
jgi:phosphate transport system permease protein